MQGLGREEHFEVQCHVLGSFVNAARPGRDVRHDRRRVSECGCEAWLSELPASTPAGLHMLHLDSAVSSGLNESKSVRGRISQKPVEALRPSRCRGYRNLTEILVDVLEAGSPRDTQQCAELVQIFFDTFKEDGVVGCPNQSMARLGA